MKLENFLVKLERYCIVLFIFVVFAVFFLNKNFGVNAFFELPPNFYIENFNIGIMGLLSIFVSMSVIHSIVLVGITYLAFLVKKNIGALLWVTFFVSYLYGLFVEPLIIPSGGVFLFVFGLLVVSSFLFLTVRTLFLLRKKNEITF